MIDGLLNLPGLRVEIGGPQPQWHVVRMAAHRQIHLSRSGVVATRGGIGSGHGGRVAARRRAAAERQAQQQQQTTGGNGTRHALRIIGGSVPK
jgi:hypothetical protein